jgi:hypothetical protein
MRGKLTLLVLALTMFSPGCALIKDGVHGVSTSISDCVDDARERRRNWKCAEGTWQQIRASDPLAYSRDYAQGFKEGFAEYLYSGKEDPPAVAPAQYRRFSYQTPQGYRAIEDWFAGYRYGVAAAIETGYRRLVTAPVSAPLASVPPEPAVANVKAPGSPPDPIIRLPNFVTPGPLATQGKSLGGEKLPLPVPLDRAANPPVLVTIPPAKFGAPQARDSDGQPVGNEMRLEPPAIVIELVPPSEERLPASKLGGLRLATPLPD